MDAVSCFAPHTGTNMRPVLQGRKKFPLNGNPDKETGANDHARAVHECGVTLVPATERAYGGQKLLNDGTTEGPQGHGTCRRNVLMCGCW